MLAKGILSGVTGHRAHFIQNDDVETPKQRVRQKLEKNSPTDYLNKHTLPFLVQRSFGLVHHTHMTHFTTRLKAT